MPTYSKRKALGQHFLTNPGILHKITAVIAPEKDDTIIEIGPGKGSLTRYLAEKAGNVIAIEKDPVLIPALRTLPYTNLTILEADFLSVDLLKLVKDPPVIIAGNLPYSISSPIMTKLLKNKMLFKSGIFLLQKEVAERICAQLPSKKQGPLTILLENYFKRKIHFTLPPGSFNPPPEVHSSLISLTKKEHPDFEIKNDQIFLDFLQTCFRHRRKKLSNNLKTAGWEPDLITKVLKIITIDEKVRPEDLTLPDYFTLFNSLGSPGQDA
ncbi:MAG: ribosomal RNA small subunit methyltransferase A [Candidatus Aminicenantes bacterium]|nr:ribosomal RNA small subunit methyltransferase A [Candidatus Aminicenantes bacterium]